MQQSAKNSSSNKQSRNLQRFKNVPRLGSFFSHFSSSSNTSKVLLSIVLSVCILCVFCYPSAQTYYTQQRLTQKLAAEAQAVSERNEQVQVKVDALNTDAGIEASAHQEFGYVKSGEGSAIVQGVDSASSSKMIQYVDLDSITAPSTWYNDILDVIFRYDNSPKN